MKKIEEGQVVVNVGFQDNGNLDDLVAAVAFEKTVAEISPNRTMCPSNFSVTVKSVCNARAYLEFKTEVLPDEKFKNVVDNFVKYMQKNIDADAILIKAVVRHMKREN